VEPLRRVLIAVGAAGALALGCGSDDRPAPAAPPDALAALPVVEPPQPPPAIPDPDFPSGTRSLRLVRSIAVRLEPGEEGKRIGTVAQDTRVGWTRTAAAPGCKKPWVEIEPRGWVCGEYLEASTRAPLGIELPRLDRTEVVPGTYGKVIAAGATIFGMPEAKGKPRGKGTPAAPPPSGRGPLVKVRPVLGSVNVRKYGEVRHGDTLYWKVGRGNEYLPAKAIRQHAPSTYQGVRLGDDTGLDLPIAFVWPKTGRTAALRRAPNGQGLLRQVARRTVLPVYDADEEAGRPRAYRVGDGAWIPADQVRVVAPVAPPAGIGEHERWIDIDLDQQVLVAYEGRQAVYATMVSTGKKTTPTATGIWRMWKKVSETDMQRLTGEDPYSVATVPWTQFYEPTRGLALHASYWHDGYGTVRSQGCVNLAPMDARWLYFWSEPVVPPGWTMTAGVVEAPGSIVRVRSAADPDPAVQGYATRVPPPAP
jgi:hypothetical protein